MHFKHIKGFSIDGGLPSSTIYSIAELSSGQLILGTDGGLALYDGYEFDVYSKNLGNLVLENVSDLLIDKAQNIWIGSWGNGLAIYDRELNLLHHHSPDSGFPRNIQAFFQDQQGTVWVGSADGGLLGFRDSIEHYKQYQHQSGVINSPSDNRIWQINQIKDGFLWLATSNGLNHFDIENERFEHFIPTIETNLGVVDSIIRTMLPSPDKQKILVGTNRNIAIFDIQKQQFSAVNISNESLNLGFNNLSYSSDGKILMASIIGLYHTDANQLFTESDSHSHSHDSQSNENSSITLESIVDNIDIRDIIMTKNNILWAATRHSGLIKFNIIDNPITYISQFINSESNKELIGHIYSFFKDEQDIIWIGSRNFLTYLPRGELLPRHVPLKHRFNRINIIAKTPHGQIVVRDSQGTYILSKDNTKLEPFEYSLPNKTLDHKTISYLYSQGQQLWIIDKDFAIYRIEKDGYSKFVFPKGDSIRLLTDTMFNDSQQKLWISLNIQKVWHQYDKELFDFKVVEKLDNKMPSINQITQDKKGKIYFASMDGILKYNSNQQAFESNITIPNYNNSYFSIIADNQDNIWAANRDSIIKIDVDKNIKATFGFLDGLNVARYQTGAVAKDSQGRLLFGGADGIDVLEPETMKVNLVAPKLLIGDIKVNNQKISLSNNNQTEPLVLASDQNNINFELVAVELKQPRLNQYKYKLEGYDSNWSTQSNHRFASYVNLPAGDYTMLYTQ